jgi:hypothetical protein
MSTGLTRLIRPLALMALIKNLGRHRVGESSCEDETCRARRRLVVRGGDLPCEAEICRGGSRL